ncbi:uncharacterized protein LOC143275225 [Babylonia areolata]|uniref:uncharacterized protein LOC143275225 n=1 Tax=Babylonia areolata TaxID=304850 RepID=UPI003FD64572
MGKYRHGRKRMLASGAKLADVPLCEIWFFIRNAIWWLGGALLRLWEFNPFSLIARRQRHLYEFDNKGNNPIQPPWAERIGDFFRSEERRKRRLLQWVQSMVPQLGVEDFTTCWHDGLALCSLLEELCPGLCPRPHLLNPHHRVNNCRLGIKLAQRYLGVATTLIRAEEMAIADSEVEVNIMHLLQLLKWRHQKGGAPALQASLSPRNRLSSSMQSVPVQLAARGTGLKAGIVGRRAKFNILTDSAPFLDLHIEIQGPNNEVNSERITSLNQGPDRRQTRARSPPGYPVTSEEEGKSKLIEDDVGNVFLRQKSVEEDVQQNVIPFDYQCVGEGRFLVTYIPRSAGTYFISIKSYEVDIEGSPFEVKVSDWMTSWNVIPKPRVMSFDMLPSIEEAPSRDIKASSSSSSSPHSKDLKKQRPSANPQHHRMAQVSRQLTIMKKRVLKRIITRNGEEILLTPSPTLSRQSSADVSDMSEDERSVKNDSKKEKRVGPGEEEEKRRRLSLSEGESQRNQLAEEEKKEEGVGRNSARARVEQEDFSNNSCNITLSVTSFEDEQEQEQEEEEEEEKKNLGSSSNKKTDHPSPSPSSCSPSSPSQALHPHHLPTSPDSPSSSPSSSAIPSTMAPGMYPSTLKRPAKVSEYPGIHINVKSQLLGGPTTTTTTTHDDDNSPGLYPLTKDNNGTEGGGVGGRADNSHRYSQHLRVASPRCLSPSTSDDASGGDHSDLTSDFDLSPAGLSFSKVHHRQEDFHGGTPTHHPLPQEDLDNHLKTSANRRRFEESLSQRDGDADDSADACSQLVSALTEFDPNPPKRTVGRSYSDGAKLAGSARSGHFNIRLKRVEVQGGGGGGGGGGGECWWRKTCVAPDHDTPGTPSPPPPPAVPRTPLRSQNLQPHLHLHHHHHLQENRSPSGSGSRSNTPYSEDLADHGVQTPSPFTTSTSSSSGSFSSGPEEKQSSRGGGEEEQLQESRERGRRTHLHEARKKWKTFDGSTIVEEEVGSGRRNTWRFSLQGKRSHSFTVPDRHHHHHPGTDRWSSGRAYNLSTELENMSIIDKLNEDDDEILEVVIESDEPQDEEEEEEEEFDDVIPFSLEIPHSSPEEQAVPLIHQHKLQHGPETGFPSAESFDTSPSVKQTVRRNLSRQGNVTGSTKSSSETSTDTDRSNSNKLSTEVKAVPVEMEESEGRRFRTIQKQKRRVKGAKSVSRIVSYNEIKADTGWKPLVIRLHRRKKYLKVTDTTIPTTGTPPPPPPPPAANQSAGGVPPALSRESSVSCNTDLLSASPAKGSRLSSSKSSSFSETSLIFGSDVPEIPENLNITNNTEYSRQFEGMNGNFRSDEEDARLKRCDEGGVSGEESLAENVAHPGMMRDEGGCKEFPPFSTTHHHHHSKDASQGKNTTTTTTNSSSSSSSDARNTANTKRSAASATTDSRPPPYARARSDPHFNRRPHFPDNLHYNNNNNNHNNRHPSSSSSPSPSPSSAAARPPRPRDLHVLDWMQRAAEQHEQHELPERQSTVDTLDSGIENESPNYSSFVSGHRRIHRRPYPWSIDLEPSLIRANAAAAAAAAAAAFDLDSDPFSGHRRLARRSYPWGMDLDPSLVQDNGGSHPAGEGSNPDSLKLTLGVIEAAVHHTVRRLLSSSSVASSGSLRNLPNFSFRDLEESKEAGERDISRSYSDSELCSYDKEEEAMVRRRRRKRRRRRQGVGGGGGGEGGTLRRASSTTVKEDFVRSVPVLGDLGEETFSGHVRRMPSPDIAETKSDGRYSPYSVTDIPCFELPSDPPAHPHHHHSSSTTTSSSSTRLPHNHHSPSKAVPTFPHHGPRPHATHPLNLPPPLLILRELGAA